MDWPKRFAVNRRPPRPLTSAAGSTPHGRTPTSVSQSTVSDVVESRSSRSRPSAAAGSTIGPETADTSPVRRYDPRMQKHLLVALTLAFTMIAATATAQPAPLNAAGVTMGH